MMAAILASIFYLVAGRCDSCGHTILVPRHPGAVLDCPECGVRLQVAGEIRGVWWTREIQR